MAIESSGLSLTMKCVEPGNGSWKITQALRASLRLQQQLHFQIRLWTLLRRRRRHTGLIAKKLGVSLSASSNLQAGWCFSGTNAARIRHLFFANTSTCCWSMELTTGKSGTSARPRRSLISSRHRRFGRVRWKCARRLTTPDWRAGYCLRLTRQLPIMQTMPPCCESYDESSTPIRTMAACRLITTRWFITGVWDNPKGIDHQGHEGTQRKSGCPNANLSRSRRLNG